MIKIYVDGGCSGNPGPGSFGVAALNEEETILLYNVSSETTQMTTNNREELKALIHALDKTQTIFKDEQCIIYTDSAYCANMFNDWIHGWARNGWKNSKKQTVENLDLVQQLYEFAKLEFPNFELCRVRGHVGIAGNELADALATHDDNKFVKVLQKHNIKTREEVKFDF